MVKDSWKRERKRTSPRMWRDVINGRKGVPKPRRIYLHKSIQITCNIHGCYTETHLVPGLNDEALKIYQGSKGRVNRQVSTLKHYTSTSISRFVVKFHALHIKNNDVNKLSFHIVNPVRLGNNYREKKFPREYFLHRYFYLRVAKFNFIPYFLSLIIISLVFIFSNIKRNLYRELQILNFLSD